MSVGVTDLAHSIRKNSADSAVPVPLSRGQQLVAAALGYKTLASLQAAQGAEQEPQTFDALGHVVPDYGLLEERAQALGLVLPSAQLRALLKAAFAERVPGAHVHSSFNSLSGFFQEEMEAAVLSNSAVDSAIADANHDGIQQIHLENEIDPEQATIGNPLTVTIEGQVTLEIDKERPYTGSTVKFEVAATVARTGRRCFQRLQVEAASSGLDYDYGVYKPPSENKVAFALAEELKMEITEAEADELASVDAQELTGNSGEMVYSYLFDFTNQLSPELAAKLMKHNGSLQVEVGPHFFEVLNGPDEPF